MIYRFLITGKINTETMDEAVDILKIILGDNDVDVNRVEIYGKKEQMIDIDKEKKII